MSTSSLQKVHNTKLNSNEDDNNNGEMRVQDNNSNSKEEDNNRIDIENNDKKVTNNYNKFDISAFGIASPEPAGSNYIYTFIGIFII